jgi:DNA-binding XRE family transcriptional regulator
MEKRALTQQNHRGLGNRLKTHRKRAGLSQNDLGMLLGYPNEVSVCRHEGSRALPPLVIALSYEIIFQIPVSELFAGVHGEIERVVEQRILTFETALREQSTQNEKARLVAQKLAWLSERGISGEE